MFPPDASNKCQNRLLAATGVNLTYIVNFRRVCRLAVNSEKKFVCSGCYCDKFSLKNLWRYFGNALSVSFYKINMFIIAVNNVLLNE